MSTRPRRACALYPAAPLRRIRSVKSPNMPRPVDASGDEGESRWGRDREIRSLPVGVPYAAIKVARSLYAPTYEAAKFWASLSAASSCSLIAF